MIDEVIYQKHMLYLPGGISKLKASYYYSPDTNDQDKTYAAVAPPGVLG